MNTLELVEKIRDFEVDEGEPFFSRISNVIDNVDFLKWLKVNYPRIYYFAEKQFFDEDGEYGKKFEDEAPKWDIDLMEDIVNGMDEYFAQQNGQDYCHSADSVYWIIAEYILENEVNGTLIKLEETIDNYLRNVYGDDE